MSQVSCYYASDDSEECLIHAFHKLGYTIMDNLIMVNGSFYLVTDDASSLPPLEYIASSSQNRAQPPRQDEWEVVSKADAVDKLGTFGGRCVMVRLSHCVPDFQAA